MSLNSDDIAFLANDFEAFAKTSLYIRTKHGSIERFEFNKAQKYIHTKLEDQKRRTGKVRALILKGRQQGCSTYVGARGYHKAIFGQGQRIFILAHRDDATNNLFAMVKRYLDNTPEGAKPNTKQNSAKSLSFEDVDSSYGVGTSGGGTVGRSDTVQFLHGSEVGFWENTDEISSGIMQTVSDAEDTEIILESTANGMGNMFHKMCMKALRGESEYELIFIPWYWQDEYRAKVPDDYRPTAEEKELQQQYGLDDAQIMWRRNKIATLAGGEWQFKQEYPNNPQEAFQVSGEDSFIQPEVVMRARKSKVQYDGDLLIGVDPAGDGDDRTAICFREGRNCSKIYTLKVNSELENTTMQVAGHVAELIEQHNPLKVFIDCIGVGQGVCDRLSELGYKKKFIRVNAAESSADQLCKNLRAEMWKKMRDWLLDVPVQIPDSDELQIDLTCLHYDIDSNRAIQLESKKSLKKRGYRSPDMADALALTFAKNIFKYENQLWQKKQKLTQKAKIDSIFG